MAFTIVFAPLVFNGEIAMNIPDRLEAKYYGVAAKDAAEVASSTSGGIASVLAREVIAKGGVVFGAAFDPFPVVRHIGIETDAGIESLKGSKYVESDIKDALREVKELLLAGRRVLFIGLPCQVSALYGILHGDDENLITVDLICHGKPPRKLFVHWVSELEHKLGANIKRYWFRNKRGCGWNDAKTFMHYVELDNGRLVEIPSRWNWYGRYFLGNASFMSGCYKCPFAKIPRVADLTCGDFWGAGADQRFMRYVESGLSLVSVQSKKGESLLDEVAGMADVIPVDSAFALKCNPQLIHPSKRPIYRNILFSFVYAPSCIRWFCDVLLFGPMRIVHKLARIFQRKRR